MITTAILGALMTMASFVVSLFPSIDLPSWLQPGGTLPSLAADIGAKMGGMNGWMPIAEAVTLLPITLGILGAVFAFKGVQFVWSLVTGGGGAT